MVNPSQFHGPMARAAAGPTAAEAAGGEACRATFLAQRHGTGALMSLFVAPPPVHGLINQWLDCVTDTYLACSIPDAG